MAAPRKKIYRIVSLAIFLGSLAVLGYMGQLIVRDSGLFSSRLKDEPPQIEFTWTPLGPLSLKDMKGRLTMKDDYALDFTTYRFRVVELDKTIDMPIDGLLGSDYESDVYLALLANDPRLPGLDRLTLEISVADDRGQKTTISRIVRIKPPPMTVELNAATGPVEAN
jgi:hypothetical protein